MTEEAALSRLGGLHHLSARALSASLAVAIAPGLALALSLYADLWLEPLQAFLNAHSLFIDQGFEDVLGLLGPYIVVGSSIALAGRERMALVFALFPLSFAISMGCEEIAWRSAFLFYPLLIVGHAIYSVIGWWELVASVLGALSSSVVIDRAGVRVQRGRGRHYWPVELLENVSIESDALVARANGGTEVARVALGSDRARDTALRIQARFAVRKRAKGRAHGHDLTLPRHGDSLGNWCRALELAWTCGMGPGYRSRAVDLTRFVQDDTTRGASAEWSAAVAYISIRMGGAIAQRALARLDTDTPPIELGLAAIAAGTRQVVPPELWLETTSYLDREQREELEALLVSDPAGSRKSAGAESACPCTAPEVASPRFDAAATRALP